MPTEVSGEGCLPLLLRSRREGRSTSPSRLRIVSFDPLLVSRSHSAALEQIVVAR